jgi:hypothetical protein
MAKRAVSVTLDSDNLTWLRARALAAGSRSVSDFLDSLIAEARSGAMPVAIRSVVGTIDIDPSDPFLKDADDLVRAQFSASLTRPSRTATGRRPVSRPAGRKKRA